MNCKKIILDSCWDLVRWLKQGSHGAKKKRAKECNRSSCPGERLTRSVSSSLGRVTLGQKEAVTSENSTLGMQCFIPYGCFVVHVFFAI